MKNWTVKTRIIAAFAVVILAIVLLAGFVLWRLDKLKQRADEITGDAVPGMNIMMEISSYMSKNRFLTLKRLRTANSAEQRQDDATIQTNEARIDDLFRQYEKTVIGDKDREVFNELKAAQHSYRLADEKIRNAGSADVAGLQPAFEAAAEQEEQAAEKGSEINRQTGDRDGEAILNEVHTANRALFLGVVAAFLLAIASGVALVSSIDGNWAPLLAAIEVMRRGDFSKRVAITRSDEFGTLAEGLNRLSDDLTSLIGEIQKTGIQVNTSATEIAAAAKEQQATANEIAATTSEIGATSREISATGKELSKTMNGVTHVAEKTAAVAGSGQAGLTRMQQTIEQISAASVSISAKLAVLNEKAGNISSVVTTITKVADQTNLLSLNAAIEAEKAGEYGRGFAVVATEIRRLADQTAVATHDIEQMIKQMQSAVSAGVMGMDKFSDEIRRGVEVVRQVSGELADIIDQVQTLTPNFETVNQGMQAQSVAAEQISETLSQLNEAAQQTVDSLRQSKTAIEQLNDVTRGLQNGISRFTLQT